MKTFGLLAFSVLVAACGGKFDGGLDGGNGNDASTDAPHPSDAQPAIDVISPPPPACTPIQGSTTVASDGSCQSNASWSCGTTKYSVQCECPGDDCSCTQDNGNSGSGTVISKVPNMCPGCSGDLAAICNFPH